MRHFGKRVLGAVLCAALLLCTVPAGNIAVSAGQSGDYEYEILEDGTARITKYNGDGGDVAIPGKIDEYKVTEIGDHAFFECYSLTSITFPDSVTIIGFSAFDVCMNLKEITFSENLTTIGVFAFHACESLTSVNIPARVKEIEGAFDYCRSLSEIIVDDANPYYCDIDGVLFNKTKTRLITYPAAKQGAFTIPDSVTEPVSFDHRAWLTELTIPAGVQEVSFGYCLSLTAIHVDSDNPYYCDIDGVLFNKEKTEIIEYPRARQGAYTVPDNVTGTVDFAYCTGLTELTIGSGAQVNFHEFEHEYEGIYYFNDFRDRSLTSIYVSDVNPYYCDIDGVLFNKEKTELIKYPPARQGPYIIPYNVTGANFDYCIGLTELTVPASAEMVGLGDCPSLTAIHVNAANPEFCDIDGVLFSKNKTRLITYPGGRKGEYTIPEGVTEIRSAFSNCHGITEVHFPQSLTSIGENAFEDCTSLKTVTIPGSMNAIAVGAFEGCISLVSVTIEEGVKGIDSLAFFNCPNLTSLTIPSSVTEIEYGMGVVNGPHFGYDDTNVFPIEINGFIVSGYKGTAAEKYAKDYGFAFLSLDEDIPVPDINEDGKQNLQDVQALYEAIDGKNPYALVANLNGDSEVDIADALCAYLIASGNKVE